MMLKTKFLKLINRRVLFAVLAAVCLASANAAIGQEHRTIPTPKQRREPPVMPPPAVKAEPPSNPHQANAPQTDAPKLAPAGGVPQLKPPTDAADTTSAQAKASATPTAAPTAAEAVNEAGELDEELAKDATTEINVKNADIAAIVRIFSKRAKRNYILDENVKGKVSIYLPGKVSSDESIRILDSVLALKGFTSVPIGENLWKIIPSKEAKQATIPTITGDKDGPASAAIVTRLINLKYVGADDIKQLIQPLVSNEGLINAYTGTNSLILIDSEDNIQRLAHLIQSLDVPFSDRELTIIPVKNAEAADIAKKLADILGQGQGESGAKGDTGTNVDLIRARLREATSAVNQPPQMNRAITTAPLGGTGSASGATVGRSREPKIIPDERTNSIIVVADDDTTARIRALISQLDSEVDLSGYRFYVYHCQYASADDLAQVLSGLVGGGGGSTSTRSSDTGLGSDMFGQGQTGFGQRGLGGSSSSRSGSSSSRSRSRLSGQQRTPGQSRNQGNKKGVSSANIGDNISITADPSTNSLIINASKTDYMKIKELLQELDVKRRQVLVEAMLLEVGVEVGMSLGTDFLVSAGGKDGGLLAKSDFNSGLSQLFSDPTKISNFAAAAASAGTLTLPGNITIPTQSVLLQAAQSNSNVNILSAPNILATDNEPAEIVVGQNVPFIASKATSDTNLNNTFNQIDRQDVGITLRLTPKISSGDSVSLQIFTEVSAVVEATASSELGPSTTIRTSETSVVAKDGQMIVIGGLISDASNDSEAGVPFLKDIPVLGHLFRTTNEGKKRTNLLIFITPRIVQDQYDAREVTLARRDRLESDIYVENQYPDRSEILHSKDLDKVSQTSGMEVSKPGTIVGSRKEMKEPAAQESAQVQNESGDTIELKVVPKLPGESSPAEKPALKKSETKSAAPQNPVVSAVVESGDRYIVMETKVKGKEASHLPFKVAKKNGLFGVVMPSDGSTQAQQFFQVGETYRYEADGQGVEVKPLGIFHSEGEAKEYYSSLKGEWYTLSPYEVMNIGKGPWVKGTKAAG